MIRYKNIQAQLKAIGLSTVRIRNERILSESTLTRLRNNQPVTTEVLDIICTRLHCQPNDIMEVVPDVEPTEEL